MMTFVKRTLLPSVNIDHRAQMMEFADDMIHLSFKKKWVKVEFINGENNLNGPGDCQDVVRTVSRQLFKYCMGWFHV